MASHHLNVISFGFTDSYRFVKVCVTEVTIDELKQARYMSLTSPPASPEAKRLVDSIIDINLSAEQRKRSRQPSAAVAFKSAVGLIVGDLLTGLLNCAAVTFLSFVIFIHQIYKENSRSEPK